MVEQLDKATVRELIDQSNEKLEELVQSLSSANLILESRVDNNKERFMELRSELKEASAEISQLKDKISRMDEKLIVANKELSELNKNLLTLQDLRIGAEVQKMKSTKFEKNWGVILSIVVAVIITIISLLIESLTH